MKGQSIILAFSLVPVLFSAAKVFALSYDFTSPGAAVLDGSTSGDFIVDGIALEVQAGLMNNLGDFTLGGNDAALLITTNGLGMTSDIAPSYQIQADTAIAGIHDGVVFNFDPLFIPETISLASFFDSEDIRMYVDGALVGDFLGDSSGSKTINLGGGTISSLAITSLGDNSPLQSSDDSDYYVASIKGTVVPEPSTMLLLGTGIAGLAGSRLRRKKSA